MAEYIDREKYMKDKYNCDLIQIDNVELVPLYQIIDKLEQSIEREQESVLDKIKEEIDKARFIDKDTRHCRNALASGLEVALDIIDKYRTESEV